jgi:hypothetical protein
MKAMGMMFPHRLLSSKHDAMSFSGVPPGLSCG